MEPGLVLSAALLGLASAPHCTVMCSAPCAAAIGGGGWRAGAAFQLARAAGYAAGGAAAAASVAALAAWSQFSPALRPFWTLLNAAALVLGLWLLVRGRQPAWMAMLAPPRAAAVAVPAGGWQAMRGPLRAGAAGLLWVGWPCGLLQSALLVAALAGDAVGGAAVMLGFALASAPGLVFGPWAWRRLLGGGDAAVRERWAIRGAGALLVAATAWALGHGMWPQVQAFCARL